MARKQYFSETTPLFKYQEAGTVMPADVLIDPVKLKQWMKDHPEATVTNANKQVIKDPRAVRVDPRLLKNTPKVVPAQGTIDYPASDPRSQSYTGAPATTLLMNPNQVQGEGARIIEGGNNLPILAAATAPIIVPIAAPAEGAANILFGYQGLKAAGQAVNDFRNYDYDQGLIHSGEAVLGIAPAIGGVSNAAKEVYPILRNTKQEFIYNAIDPLGYGAIDKVKRFPKTFYRNVTNPVERPFRIGKDFSSQLGDEAAVTIGKKRLDAWRTGLQLPQKYETFTKTGPNTYTINNMQGISPKDFSALWNDIRARNFANSNSGIYSGENPLVALSEEYEKISTPTVNTEYGPMNFADMKRYLRKKGDVPQLEPWKQGRIVEDAKNSNYKWSVYDNDNTNGIMAGYRWDVTKTPTGQLKFKYNDTWDLHPWAPRGETAVIDPADEWAKNFRAAEMAKHAFKPLQNVEALRLLGGKPFNIEGEFIVDPKTMEIVQGYKEVPSKEKLIDLWRIQRKDGKTFAQLYNEGNVHPIFKNKRALDRMAEQEKYFGQWFTKDKNDFDFYISDREFKDPEVLHLQVPESKLDQYQNYDKSLSRASEREFVIPHEDQQKYLVNRYSYYPSPTTSTNTTTSTTTVPTILQNYRGLQQHKNGGWLNKYK